MKLWDKGFTINKLIEDFTIGKDKELDLYLASFDILGTIAHIIMLESIGIISGDELKILKKELISIYKVSDKEGLQIENGVEDIHSQIEFLLTKKLGEAGKKVHTGRSRNDQVLLDLKLFMREWLKRIALNTHELFNKLVHLSEKYKHILLPGYTHLQIAMPSSFGLWFGSYAESLVDDMHMILTAYKITNQNPLGSAAGYGSSFPLDRKMTTELLGFDELNYNVVYAQMCRGKNERIVSYALANLAGTISKLAYDVCLYLNQNFNFISLPKEYTTGSSIMPHKKNPDVFELIRAKCNKIQSLPAEILSITNNLPSGYFRDYQILKETIIPAFEYLQSCLIILIEIIDKVEVKEDILQKEMYSYIFSVEEVNKLVLRGIPFREAYKIVGEKIEKGEFIPDTTINHTLEGSIGNLCNEQIIEKMDQIYKEFNFSKVEKALLKLLKN